VPLIATVRFILYVKWIVLLRVPTSLDTFNFQHRMYFPGAFRSTDAAHNHSAFDLAGLAMRAVEKDEAGHSNFYECLEYTLVGAPGIQ